MTAYANYSFYTDEYLSGRAAAVTSADFSFYANNASKIIDRYTFSHVDPDNVPEEVKMCCCELAELAYKSENSKAAVKNGIASESVQGWSQSYESSDSRRLSLRSAQRDCIFKWLSGTGLLYAGVSGC